jgi:hypothetical protein
VHAHVSRWLDHLSIDTYRQVGADRVLVECDAEVNHEGEIERAVSSSHLWPPVSSRLHLNVRAQPTVRVTCEELHGATRSNI